MITEKKIRELIEEKTKGTDRFIVSVKVSSAKKIEVLLDGLTNIAINDCIEISRFIESSLDREQEDFELMVSSAGIDQPFTVEKQYQKNIGRELSVLKKDGIKLKGILTTYEPETSISIESEKIIKNEKNKKQTIKEQITIPLQEIKESKLILSFK
jgi:ribosome maturation factor RimP